MSTLYVFGCSYSGLYDDTILWDPEIKKYYDFRGGNFPLTWSELLAKELNLNLVNTARWGADNYEIFEKFCIESNQIKEGDVVLIGWTGINRFRLYSDNSQKLNSVNIWTKLGNNFENISQKTIDEVSVNRTNKKWADEIRNWMLLINRFSEMGNFKVINWTFFNDIYEIDILNYLLDSGGEYITHETNGLIINEHMGEKGHIRQCEHFKSLILK